MYPVKNLRLNAFFYKHRRIKSETFCGARVMFSVIVAEAYKHNDIRIMNVI